MPYFFLSNQYVSIPIRGIKPPTHSNRTEDYSFNYKLNGQVSGNMKYTIVPCIVFLNTNCLSAIRFRGGVILQVSCYTLLMRIPTSMATVAFCTTRNTLSVYRKVGADNVRPGLSWKRQVESLIASSAYQKWPTTNLWYYIWLRYLLSF